MTHPMSPDTDKLLELAKAAQKIAPGQWETDSIENEGAYGSGEDVHHGFKSYVVGCGPVDNWKAIADSSNSDLICVEEDFDEDSHYAWDENSRVLFEHIAAANPKSIIALVERLRLAEERADALQKKCAMTIGVGDGSGQLFVHGDYESIKAVQNIILNKTSTKAERDSAFNEGVEAAAKYHIDMAELWEKAARYADTENDITRKDQSTNESGAHRTHARRILALTRPTPAQSENRDE